ncbi:ROK family protein [Candidatus Saccharibacteria bacterium]|nr:ROK family protein [Candidatus Saccharibacteria bacterium]
MTKRKAYLAIDIGGTKTLVAVFSESGDVVYKNKFSTNPNYSKFIEELKQLANKDLKNYQLKLCCCGAPGYIDRRRGIVRRFGNLNWHNVPLKEDVGRALGGVAVLVENDAKLAGLSEAILVQKKYNNVLYLTISTGIGDGIIINGKIDSNLADSEAGQMVIEHKGQLVRWEDIASGRALVEEYGKKASQIDDPLIWKRYVMGLAKGIDTLVAVLRPEVIIIGGGVGAHFEKFDKLLVQELEKFENRMIKMPPILKAKRPEEAVIYGCYDFIKQQS